MTRTNVTFAHDVNVHETTDPVFIFDAIGNDIYTEGNTVPVITLKIFDMEKRKVLGVYRGIYDPKMVAGWKAVAVLALDFTRARDTFRVFSPSPAELRTVLNELVVAHVGPQNERPRFYQLEWYRDNQTISYMLDAYNPQDGGRDRWLCIYSLAGGQERCILGELGLEERGIREYRWSEDGRYLVFMADYLPELDKTSQNIGIADPVTGKFVMIGDNDAKGGYYGYLG